jgi:hypothetical protein
MCNCGKKRSALKPQAGTLTNASHQRIQQAVYEQQIPVTQLQVTQTVMFQYMGNSALTVTGSITRKNYRFNFPGDIQHVAFSDAAAMKAIPVLKKV